MKNLFLALTTLLTITACGSAGEAGDACESDSDCAEGLECHIEEHEEDDDDHDHEESGVCEEHDAHDDE